MHLQSLFGKLEILLSKGGYPNRVWIQKRMDIHLLQHIGDMSQLAGITRSEISSGPARGDGIIEVYNAAGLRFRVLESKCLDILDLSYQGINMGFISKNGIAASSSFNALDGEFPYYFIPGMLTTCGLANIGNACFDNGAFRNMHGRISNKQPEYISTDAHWEGSDYILSVSGKMKDSYLYGYNLHLDRKMEVSLYGKHIDIYDQITNVSSVRQPYAVLYHFNFGYPLLDAGAKLVKGPGAMLPRDADAEAGLAVWDQITAPIPQEPERVYYHTNIADETGYCYAGIYNQARKLGAYIQYSANNLPYITQWKSMCAHDYVLGLEPCNSFLRGCAVEQSEKNMRFLEPYETIHNHLRFCIIDGDPSYQALLNIVHSIEDPAK